MICVERKSSLSICYRHHFHSSQFQFIQFQSQSQSQQAMLHTLLNLHPSLPNHSSSSSSMSSSSGNPKRPPVDLPSPSDPPKRLRSDLLDTDVDPDLDSDSDAGGLRLLGLLLQCAECVATENLDDAALLLPEIAELSSPYGSSAQRVGAYFADALSARVLTSCLGAYAPLSPQPPHLQQRLLNALQIYNSAAPLIKFAHFTANQAIQQAVDGADHVHVIDFDVMQGLQWPGLLHILASKPRRIKSLRITGLGSSADLLAATGRRLAEFAAAFNIPFQFHALDCKIGNVKDLNQLGLQIGETVVVHWMHHCLYDVAGNDLNALKLLTLIKPKLITIIEQDLTHSGTFLGRFVEALHYYSALFDALGDGLATENVDRHVVEQQLFGREIRNIVAVGGPKRTGEVKVEKWGDELSGAGFQPVSLAGNPAAQASLLLGMFPWQGYTLVEENGYLKLGWKDLSLLTASAWQSLD